MSFADAMRKEGSFTRTENGAVALNTTGNALLDLFGTIGSLREADHNRVETLFAEAYSQDPLFATKILFYARDIREGLALRIEPSAPRLRDKYFTTEPEPQPYFLF